MPEARGSNEKENWVWYNYNDARLPTLPLRLSAGGTTLSHTEQLGKFRPQGTPAPFLVDLDFSLASGSTGPGDKKLVKSILNLPNSIRTAF